MIFMGTEVERIMDPMVVMIPSIRSEKMSAVGASSLMSEVVVSLDNDEDSFVDKEEDTIEDDTTDAAASFNESSASWLVC
jgi:hypothetical protein